MAVARILAGLPPYGPPALSFPRPGAFREGVVVEFLPYEGEQWAGNFASGWGGPTGVYPRLGERAVLVLAAGAGYVVDAAARALERELGGDQQEIWWAEAAGAYVATNGLWFVAHAAEAPVWRSRRLSWDGVRGVCLDGAELTGEAYSPVDEGWHAFAVDLRTGEASGGSYNGPPM